MTSIIPFIRNAVFEPEGIKMMSDAFNRAMKEIHAVGHPNKIVKEIIAKRIIKLAQDGERDSYRLCERAVAACGFNLDRAG